MNNNQQQRVLGRILSQRVDAEDVAAVDAAGGTIWLETYARFDLLGDDPYGPDVKR